MLIEPVILYRHEGGGQLRWQVAQAQRFADEIAIGREGLATAILQHQCGPPFGVHRGFGARQIVGGPDDDPRQNHQPPNGNVYAQT